MARALAYESYDPKELETALSREHSKLSLVNTLLFQGLEKEFGKGRLLGLNVAVSTSRTVFNLVKKIRGNA